MGTVQTKTQGMRAELHSLTTPIAIRQPHMSGLFLRTSLYTANGPECFHICLLSAHCQPAFRFGVYASQDGSHARCHVTRAGARFWRL